MRALDDARRWAREALYELEHPRQEFDADAGTVVNSYNFPEARQALERALDALRRLAPGAVAMLLGLTLTACGPEPGACVTPAEVPELGAETDGTCKARGVMPALDACEPADDGYACSLALVCEDAGRTLEVTVAGGFVDVTVLVPTLETLGTAHVLCWSRHEARP